MNLIQFILECEMRGIRIMIEGENLRVTGALKPATADYIRKHKQAIIKQLNSEHGACDKCGVDTANMLTTPDAQWCWMCAPCFHKRHERKQPPARHLNRKKQRNKSHTQQKEQTA